MTTEPLTKRTPLTAGEVRSHLAWGDNRGGEQFANGCLDKAADDEPVFVLRAQDRFAPDVVEHWATLVETRNGGKQTEKTRGARDLARRMRQWQRVEQVDPDTGARQTVDRSKVPD